MLLSEASQRYALANLRSASSQSLRLWEIALRWFDRCLGRPAELTDLNDESVARFILWRRKTVSAGTINRDLGTILALWRWCHRQRLVDVWPTIELEPVPARTPIAWTRREFNRLYHVAMTQRGDIGNVRADVWWPALLLVLYDTGERIGAVLRLVWNDVDLRGRWIRFPAENRKGRTRDSLARIAPDTVTHLRRLRRSPGPVFPWPYGYTYVWFRYGRLLREAGLPDDRARKFHCVRKTTASHLEALGGNATDALRHSSRRITLLYLDPKITKPAQPIDRLWRPDSK